MSHGHDDFVHSNSSGLTRRGFLAAGGAAGLGALLAACGLGGASSKGGQGSGKGSIRALFMKQAGYSEENIRAMTASFQKANPNIKVTADFVSYEALHDKIVAAAPAGTYDVVLIDVIWPAELGTKKIVADVTTKWPASWKQDMLPGAVATPLYGGRGTAVDIGHVPRPRQPPARPAPLRGRRRAGHALPDRP